MRCDEVKKVLSTHYVLSIKEYNELYWNKNKTTNTVNNSLITTMTTPKVFKTHVRDMCFEIIRVY
jgi:hypothetical protein